MNDPLADLESELRRLRPRRPSPELELRLEHALGEEAGPAEPEARPIPRVRWWQARWSRWGTASALAGLAAGLLVVLLRPGSDAGSARPAGGSRPAQAATAPAQRPQPAIFEPVAASNFVYASFDQGMTLLRDDWPARRVQDCSVDVYLWRNPQTNASVRWTVLREDVRLVPVEAY